LVGRVRVCDRLVCLWAASLVGFLGVRGGVATATTFGIRIRHGSGGCRSGTEGTGSGSCRRTGGRIVTAVRDLLLGCGGLSGGEGLLVTGIGLLAARVEAEGLSGLVLRMLRGIRIACAEVGLTVTGAVRRPLGRVARRLCRLIGSLRFPGRRRGVLLGGSALGRCRIGARLALSILFLRRCVGAGTLTVVRLPEPLVVRLPVCLCAGLLADRLPVLLCAGLIGGGELALLSELIGSGLARPTGLAGSGLDGSTRLARTGWGR